MAPAQRRAIATSKRNIPARKRLNRKSPLVPRPLSLKNQPVDHYACALVDPFNEYAYGARVPDLYSGHTSTAFFRSSHTLTTNNTGAVGILILPSLTLSAVVPEGTASSPNYFSAIKWGDDSAATAAGWGYATPGSMQAYRIVGMGVRVTETSSMTNTSGKLLMATYPIDSYSAIKASGIGGSGSTAFTVSGLTPATNTQKSPAATLAAWGLANNSGTPVYSNIVEFPGSRVVSSLEAAENEWQLCPKPVDPRAFEFRNLDTLIGYDVAEQGGAGFSGRASKYQLNGFEACVVALQGGPATTAVLDVEVIYHVEYSVSIDNSSNSSARFATSEQSPTEIAGFFDTVAEVAGMPAVRKVLEYGADMIHPMLGKFARML